MSKRKQDKIRYAIYLRCSTDDQSQGDYTTIDTQREINTQFVQERGGVLVAEHVDEGRSGTNLKRPGWQALIADARRGKFDVVCCTNMSRLARGKTYYVAEHQLKECGVDVELVKEKFGSDMAGQVNQEMRVFIDGIYPKMVSQWTSTKMEQMVQQGYYCGGTVPYGYRTEPISDIGGLVLGDRPPPKRFVVDAEAAEVVSLAYDLFLEKRSVAEVVKYLSSVTDRRWTHTTAKNLLTNGVYIGNYKFGGWRKEDTHPAIVDEDKWRDVQRLIEARRRSPSRPARSNDYTYYLRGLVKCPHCGCSYTNGAAKGGNVRYYQCLHDTKGFTKCPVGRINADALHRAILKEIERAVQHRTVMHKIIAKSGGWGTPFEAQTALRGQLA